jgi:hypothetical protein
MIDERRLGEICDYDGLIAAIRARMRELGVTNETIDAITGLQSGYVGKLLAPSRIKKLGVMSFGVMMQSLGLKLIVVEDAKTTEKMRPRWTQREKALPLLAIARMPPRATWLFTKRSGRSAAKLRAEKLPAERRHEIALNATTVRWRREREKETRQRLARQARTA